MSSTPPPDHSDHNRPHRSFDDADDTIDLRELFARVWRGLPQILGLMLIFATVGAGLALIASRVQPVDTTTRVIFSFRGFERGIYPDNSRFQQDDLRAPAVIAEALRRQSLDTSSEFQSKIRGALSIEGIIPDSVVKARDRLRASGQTPPPYIPDEYQVSLTLPRSNELSGTQRQKLLMEIVSVYRENFHRTYGQAPLAFGTAFETLRGADFAEYELVFNTEIANIKHYLDRQIEQARAFRSPTTNFSFKDLQDQVELFSQIQLNEVLGLIHENGLSRNRTTAMIKMNYYLRQLEDRERQAVEEERVVRDLLDQSGNRAENVVLGVKSQAAQTRPDAPILDQGLIDSLLANDAYNFLVRRALDAGLRVKQIQAEKNRLLDLRDNLRTFLSSTATDQSSVQVQVTESIERLETNYNKLIDAIRRTHADFALQEFGDAIRLSAEVKTDSLLRPLAIAVVLGSFLGFCLGAGLSLLGIYVEKSRPRAA
jgi:Chain length determinant protein